MIIQQVIERGKKKLEKTSVTPRLDSELLLSFTLSQSREYLFRRPDEKIKQSELKEFMTLLGERTKGMPIAHITKQQEFFGIPLLVNKHVLIPRPETEEVVEDAITFWEQIKDTKLFLDVGTGSGCIAIALAKNTTECKIIALEQSKQAIKVAEKNIKTYELDEQIELIESDVLSKLPKKYHSTDKIIVANLPYIGTTSNAFIADEVRKHEPKIALFGGKNGLELYERLLKQVTTKKISFKAMFFEIGFSQTEDVEKLVKQYLPKAQIRILKDLAGFPRTVRITST